MSNDTTADHDNALPVTRGELRRIARKLLSRIWVDYTYETPADQLARNAVYQGAAADIFAVIGEGTPPSEDDDR
jgi:hypothetical protein